jgi:hypothetical protein
MTGPKKPPLQFLVWYDGERAMCSLRRLKFPVMKAIQRGKEWIIVGLTALAILAGWAAFVRNPSVRETARAGDANSKMKKMPEKRVAATSATPNPSASAQSRQPKTAAARPRNNRKVITDPAARKALRGVGSDPEAERYWLAAINNPFLPPDERQDLIEDLNEDGLIDPRGGTADDLPLIENRIRLIEQLMPESMDRVNAEAFKEAQKDLVNLRTKLSRR